MKAIETEFDGYKFRSRLEARWAVYFQAMRIEYVYEPEGYQQGKIKYLPDFWIPLFQCFAEVKPLPFTESQFNKTLILPNSCILLDTSYPMSRQMYFVTKAFDDQTEYCHYKKPNIDIGPWMIFQESERKKRLWWAFTDISEYWIDTEPEIAARSARFEHGY